MKTAQLARFIALALVAGLSAAHAGEGARPVSTIRAGDPCLFFRAQAYSRGLDDFATDMLTACEAIERRRAAGFSLGDRLAATDLMLVAYRAAVTAALEDPTRVQHGRSGSWTLGLSHAEKYAIADATGALLALEAIRTGF